MKCILIVDVEMFDDKHLCESCPIWDKDAYCCKHDYMTGKNGCHLKPMPEQKDVGYPNDDYDVGFGDGWDACLKEICNESNSSN